MIPIDDDTRRDFVRICQDFIDIGMTVIDKGMTESVPIFFPKELAERLDYQNQFATVQYMGDSRKKPYAFKYFEIRFYARALRVAGLRPFVEARTSLRYHKWNGGGHKEYYAYADITWYSEFETYVKPILTDMAQHLTETAGPAYTSVSRPDLPTTLMELPRVKKAGR